ncbi:MAG: DoxX family protein [Acidobacteriaceae bacterium]
MFGSLDRLQPFGSLVLRLVLGVILTVHGYSKIVPRGALYNFTHMVGHLGMPPWLGYVAAFTEFFGGLLLILGLLTRIAAFACAIDMAVAILKVHLHHGLTAEGGFQFPLALFAIALMLIATGGGLLALDDLVGRGGGRVRAAR